jgi:hypothetical protein
MTTNQEQCMLPYTKDCLQDKVTVNFEIVEDRKPMCKTNNPWCCSNFFEKKPNYYFL